MDVHKPKPIRNWRELLTEIGVIVLSVCIALAAEQAVEWVHWRNQVAEARKTIASEMVANSASVVSRLRTQACTDRRLDELAQILDDAARSGSLPPVGAIGIPPRRAWVSGAWESVLASQTATHFSRAELAGLADSYTHLQRLLVISSMETAAWTDLAAVIGPGRRLDPASEAELRKALSEARSYSFTMTNLGQALLSRVKRLNLSYSQDDLDLIRKVLRASPSDDSRTFMICEPLGAPPPHYGQMPTPVRDLADEGLKYLPDLGGRRGETMDVHKPKPIRNWRELLAEIGVIVLSVCIALSAEQAVEWWHWKNRVRDAIEAMRIELRDDDGPQAYARVAMVNCFAGQLDAIQTAIEAGRPRKEIVALVDLYQPIAPTWDSNAWNAVLASDVGSHVPATQMMNWSKPYNFVPSLDKRNAQERDDRLALQPTHREGELLSAGEAETMLAAIARLRADNIGVAGRSRALLMSMRDNGITMGEDQQNYALKALRARFHECVRMPSLTAPRPGRVFPNVVMPGSLYHMGN